MVNSFLSASTVRESNELVMNSVPVSARRKMLRRWCPPSVNCGKKRATEKGYGIDSNGGIQVWQRQGTFSQSRTAYYLKKTGEKEFLTVGAANRNTKDVFQERIARYVGDDPELAERIRLSSAIRSKTIQLLRDYDPTKY